MIENIPLQVELIEQADKVFDMTWLKQEVPLWVFLIALLTKPYMWAHYAKTFVVNRLGKTATETTE